MRWKVFYRGFFTSVNVFRVGGNEVYIGVDYQKYGPLFLFES